VTAISMGGDKTALKHALAMGCKEAISVSDDALANLDTQGTAKVLAAAIQKVGDVSMAFFGKQAIDGDTAQVGPGAAIRLGLPLITYAVEISEINVDEKYAVIVRKTESGKEIIQTSLPAALTAEKAIAEIPYAALPDLITSLKFIPEVWSADEPLAYDENQIGLSGSPTMVAKSGTPEAHEPAETISVAEQGLSGAVEIILGKMLSNSSVASLLEEPK